MAHASIPITPNKVRRLTFADLLYIVARTEGLAARRRDRICSAIRVVARELGRDLDEISADPARLREGLARIGPGPAKMAAHRWQSVYSNLRRALELAGIDTQIMRHQYAYSAAWCALLTRVRRTRAGRSLTSFAKFCTLYDIAPQQVDDAASAQFLIHLKTTSRCKRPIAVQRAACLAWNEVSRNFAEWPKTVLTIINRRNTYALRWECFPASLKLDVDNYLQSLEGSASRHVDNPPDTFVGLKSCTHRVRILEINAYFSALVHKGYDPGTLETLRDAVSVEAFQNAIEFFLERGDGDNKTTARSFAALVIRIARDWVRTDAEHLRQLKVVGKQLGFQLNQMREKVRSRMTQFEHQENVEALLLLPEKLVSTLKGTGSPNRRDALRVQSALCIELLTLTPITLTLLASLEISRHLGRASGSDLLQFTIPARAGSNRIPILTVFRPETQRLIELYLARYRPVLAVKNSDWLFPGRSGPRVSAGLSVQISECVKSETGLNLTPQMFRAIAGKLMLDQEPGNYGSVRLYLGHKYVETSMRYYAEYEANAAHRYYDALVLNERGRLPKAFAPKDAT